jgi:hypothetical protein
MGHYQEVYELHDVQTREEIRESIMDLIDKIHSIKDLLLIKELVHNRHSIQDIIKLITKVGVHL